MHKKIKLKNGVSIVYEQIPYVKSVSLGIWVRTGSRNESTENNGLSHLIEHMLFKGTERRTAEDISQTIDSIGGQLNAFTGKECTCFYTKTLDEHIEIAVDLLSDMFFNSKFEKSDISVEKKVIIEEMGMYEDSPEDHVHDLLSETVWKGCSIGYPILGTRQSLKKISREMIMEYIRKMYTPSNTVIAVAGSFDENRLVELLERYFGFWLCADDGPNSFPEAVFKPDITIKSKKTEQAHICIGFEGVPNGDDILYPLLAVNNILGGGMSSRLFQNIREKRGLAYSIYSYPTTYNNAGLLTIYAGMKPSLLVEVTKLIYEEVMQLINKGISFEELNKSKEQLKGSYILGLESTSSRMSSIGKSELLLGYINSQEEILEKIQSITMDDINRVIRKVFNIKKVGVSVIGNIKSGISPQALLPT